MKALRACAALVIVAGLSRIASAQTLRGVVVDSGRVPVPGVVVSLVGTDSVIVGRALTNERGAFRLTAAVPGTYRVRTLRIGYRPATSESIALGAGAEVTYTVTVASIPFALASVRIEARSSCRPVSDPAAIAVFEVWEQARAALVATQLTATARAVTATTITYVRTLDPTGQRVLEQNANVRSELVTQPWREVAPDNLRRYGYVVTGRDRSTTYHAPGLETLLSADFVEDHCFRLTRSSVRRVGIAFEPTAARRTRSSPPEIRGVLWIDPSSAALQSLDFSYMNVSSVHQDHAGGTIDFARMSNGAWTISRWSIRTPILEATEGSPSTGGTDTSVTAIKVTGGELSLATARTGDTLWVRPPLPMAGTVVDSASRSPVPQARVSLIGTAHNTTADSRGRFRFPSVIPGAYTLEIRTPSLDSAGISYPIIVVFVDTIVAIEARTPTASQIIAAVCGRAGRDPPGVVVGTVIMNGDTLPPRLTNVIAEWTEPVVLPEGTAPTDQRIRWIETRTTANGAFRLCGVPVNTPLTLRAEHDSAGTVTPVRVTIPPNGRFARARLVLDRSAARSALFTGTVVADSTARSLEDAEVVLPDLRKSVTTDDHGRFRVGDIVPGTHRILVRRLGYAPLDTAILFRTNQAVDRRIVLRRVVTLDSVNVVANRSRLPTSFEDNRRIGLGQFITRDSLAKQEERKLGDVLRGFRGVNVDPGISGRAWLLSSRQPASISKTEIYFASKYEQSEGMRREGCYALVFHDDVLLNPSNPPEPIDINSIVLSQIEAIEYYAGPAETPAKYNRLGARCGVLVLWTRRSE